MYITNKISDYSPTEVSDMQAKINEFVATIKELDAIIEKEAMEPTPPKEGENVVYIDPTLLAEYEKYSTQALPLHDMLTVYDRWIEKYNYMVKVNVGNYKNQQLLMLMVKMRNVCISFGQGQK